MDELYWVGFAVKLLSAAAIVLIAAKVVERTDAFLGAMVATLPISAGPAYAFLAMEHPAAFIERASLVSMTINTGTSAFIVAYAFLAQRLGAVLSTAGGLAAWLAVALVMTDFAPPLVLAMTINIGAVAAGLLVTRRLVQPGRSKPPPRPQWWDVPFRAGVVMTLIGVVLIAAQLAGPKAAGMAALTPVVLASLTLILQPRIGGPASAEVMINCLTGMIGVATGLAVVHVTAAALGSPLALVLGLLTCIVWNSLLILVRQLRSGQRQGQRQGLKSAA